MIKHLKFCYSPSGFDRLGIPGCQWDRACHRWDQGACISDISKIWDLSLICYLRVYQFSQLSLLFVFYCQTLSDFQYIDSSGRDQGSNVRKKSQSLVVLVNDKERIQEVREKAASNREKWVWSFFLVNYLRVLILKQILKVFRFLKRIFISIY